jgi:diadenosine tetraphosphate (Ap4A) HIT family hydrolase
MSRSRTAGTGRRRTFVPPEHDASEYACGTCGFTLWRPLATLDVSTLGLYDDARFPGRCLLALHEHYEDLSAVPPALLSRFILDVRCAGAAITAAIGADRMNYAVLGNVEPHVHFHLIPRIFATDPIPRRPPWEHPAPVSPLASAELDGISAAIRKHLV